MLQEYVDISIFIFKVDVLCDIWATSWENLLLLYANNKSTDPPLLFAA